MSSKQHNKVQHCLGCISFQLALMVRVSYSDKFWHRLRKHERDAKRELLPCWNSKLLSFVKSSHKNNHFANIKTNISLHTQTSGTHFRRVSPFNITPVRRAHKDRTCWYRWRVRLIYWYQIKEKYENGMDRHNTKLKTKRIFKCIMANTGVSGQQAARTTYQLSSPSCSATAIQKA